MNNPAKDKILEYAELIDATPQSLPFFDYSEAGNDGAHYFLFENEKWRHIYYERGTPKDLFSSQHLEEALYLIMKHIVASTAYLQTAEENKDRTIMENIRAAEDKEPCLMEKISPVWAERLRKEVQSLNDKNI